MISRSESYSRLTEGQRCRWRRLLGYHFNDKGITPNEANKDLLIGGAVHKCLETALGRAREGHDFDHAILDPIIDAHRNAVTRMVPSDSPVENGNESAAMVEGLSHAWVRITLPWVLENFTVLDIEQMEKLKVGDMTFRARADFIARHKETGQLSVHDFKTLSYWDDKSAEQWHFNIQMYATAYLIAQRLGEPVPHYYIHPLVKGNKKYPSPIVKPWTAPAVTPMGKPHFSLKWKKGFERQFVHTIMKVSDFVWSLPADKLAAFVPVAGPYGVDDEMAKDYIDSAVVEDDWWFDNLYKTNWKEWDDPVAHADMVRRFPRSYQCWDFKRLCEFHRLCFRRKGWEDPYSFGYKVKTFK
ncbi:MAG: PD-(D/E)XK nuclease family protein [bacterium]|nr:PD-(D/E)XK nuclease family protein [bacterium]